MDEAADKPKPPPQDLMHLAEQLATQAEHYVPPWRSARRPGKPLAGAGGFDQRHRPAAPIPVRYTLVPRWPLVAMEVLLLVVLLVLNPIKLTRPTRLGKTASYLLLAAITVDNTASAVILDYHIVTGKVSNDPAVLLGSGAAVFITNIIVFGIWYWEKRPRRTVRARWCRPAAPETDLSRTSCSRK